MAGSDRRGRGPAQRDWVDVERSLDANGNAVLPGLLTGVQCEQLAAGYSQKRAIARRS